MSITSNFLQVLGLSIFIAVYYNYVTPFEGEIHSDKILRGATLARDSKGIPQIQAKNYKDGLFALGFAHAEDRLWQMFIGTKIALGEISEIFYKQGLEFDKFSRMLNLKKICTDTLNTFTNEERENLQAYTDGVNYYIQTKKVLPIEFLLNGIGKFEWKNEYSCLSIKLVEYYLSSDFLREIIRDYLLNTGVISKETIEKLFPFEISHFESQNTIIKNDEALALRNPLKKAPQPNADKDNKNKEDTN